MGTTTGDAAALKAKLDALVKDAEEAEKAVAARRRARAARTLLEEEQTAAALEKATVASLCRDRRQVPLTRRRLHLPMRRPSSSIFTSRQRSSSTSVPS
jgi:hypothetical protein